MKRRSRRGSGDHRVASRTVPRAGAGGVNDLAGVATTWVHGRAAPTNDRGARSSGSKQINPNERWQADVTHWALADRADVEILNLSTTTLTSADRLRRPGRVQSHGCHHLPYHPQTCGKIEPPRDPEEMAREATSRGDDQRAPNTPRPLRRALQHQPTASRARPTHPNAHRRRCEACWRFRCRRGRGAARQRSSSTGSRSGCAGSRVGSCQPSASQRRAHRSR